MENSEARTFYLMLSAVEGQKYADIMGYHPPSEDVQKMELVDVLSRWFVFEKAGLLDEIKEASSAFVDLLQKVQRIQSPPDEFTSILEAFSVSLINKMLESNVIGLALPASVLDKFRDNDGNIDHDLLDELRVDNDNYDEFYDLIEDHSLFDDLEGND